MTTVCGTTEAHECLVMEQRAHQMALAEIARLRMLLDMSEDERESVLTADPPAAGELLESWLGVLGLKVGERVMVELVTGKRVQGQLVGLVLVEETAFGLQVLPQANPTYAVQFVPMHAVATVWCGEPRPGE